MTTKKFNMKKQLNKMPIEVLKIILKRRHELEKSECIRCLHDWILDKDFLIPVPNQLNINEYFCIIYNTSFLCNQIQNCSKCFKIRYKDDDDKRWKYYTFSIVFTIKK